MTTFTQLLKAKTTLGLNDKASLFEIKDKYKSLMKKWHPDINDDIATATLISTQINEAYAIVLRYCNKYEYPFDEESLKKATLSPQEWLEEKFGAKKTMI